MNSGWWHLLRWNDVQILLYSLKKSKEFFSISLENGIYIKTSCECHSESSFYNIVQLQSSKLSNMPTWSYLKESFTFFTCLLCLTVRGKMSLMHWMLQYQPTGDNGTTLHTYNVSVKRLEGWNCWLGSGTKNNFSANLFWVIEMYLRNSNLTCLKMMIEGVRVPSHFSIICQKPPNNTFSMNEKCAKV